MVRVGTELVVGSHYNRRVENRKALEDALRGNGLELFGIESRNRTGEALDVTGVDTVDNHFVECGCVGGHADNESFTPLSANFLRLHTHISETQGSFFFLERQAEFTFCICHCTGSFHALDGDADARQWLVLFIDNDAAVIMILILGGSCLCDGHLSRHNKQKQH